MVGLASNVSPEHHLRLALGDLGERFPDLRRSPVCVSPAVGYSGPDYWNLCVTFTTTLSASALVSLLKVLERRLGRAPSEPRYAPKTLDADLLLLGDETGGEPPLPNPEIFSRAYVLGPLARLFPGLVLPGGGPALAELWKNFEGERALRFLPGDPFRSA